MAPSDSKPAIQQIFDAKRRRAKRARGARIFERATFLHERIEDDILDRLETVMREFPNALVVGAHQPDHLVTEKSGIGHLVIADSVPARLAHTATAHKAVLFDEEFIPFADQSFDLVISILGLHAVNDPVGSLVQYRRLLRPDGLFIGVVFGGDTLERQKLTLIQIESEITGGAALRFAPMADIRQWGAALSRAGFALPVTDRDSVRVSYSDPQNLRTDLRAWGEGAAFADASGPINRHVAAQFLAQLSDKKNEALYELMILTGWAPAPNQQKPLKPGSARQSLAQSVLASKSNN